MQKLYRLFIALLGVLALYSQENPICVSLVVKNQEATILQCLKSVKEVASCISVCDLGSTDRTKEIVADFLRMTGIPGTVHQREAEDSLYHPSIGATAAQKTLKSYGFPLSKSYVLMLEGDQLLCLEGKFEEKLIDDSYLLLEKSSLFSCYQYQPHLFRASLTPEQIARTDWGKALKKVRSLSLAEQIPLPPIEGGLPEEEQKEWIETQQKKYREEKLASQIELYRNALEKDPEQIEAYLYLGHCYKTLKQYDKAIEYYQKRIEKKGKGENIWFSLYSIGECQEEMGLWVHALYWYLEAFQFDPSRPESLHKIAHHYRLHGQADLAYLFAKHGWRIPKSGREETFPASFLRDYQFDEEISITAFYTRFKEEGYAASSDLLLRKDAPYNIREQGYRNLLFYVQNLKARFASIHIPLPLVDDEKEETYHPMNPSIHKTENGYKLICRSVNYTQTGAKHFHTNDPQGIFRTRNFLVHYDRSFRKIAQHEIIEDLPRERHRDYILQGLEDCRIIDIDGVSWFSCSTFDTNPTGAIQVTLCEMKEESYEKPVKVETFLPLKGPDPNRHEKNWLPFLHQEELCFVYSSEPFIIYKPNFETGDMIPVLERSHNHDFSRFRGSAAPISFDGGYLMLIHEVVQMPDFTRCYLHRFVYLDSSFTTQKVSKPFTFKHVGVEYCLSMTWSHDGEELIMPIGIEDHEAYLAFVSLKDVRDLLEPLPPIYPPF